MEQPDLQRAWLGQSWRSIQRANVIHVEVEQTEGHLETSNFF
jgi:hypothetical protein